MTTDFRPPMPATSSAPADWLLPRLDLWAADWVAGTVGSGFPAYARIFHSLGETIEHSRWADVAVENGRVMHPGAQWDLINSTDPAQDRGGSSAAEPTQGDLGARPLAALCSVLAEHTSTPDECWFAVWDGWGWQHAGAFTVLSITQDGETAPPMRPAPPSWQLDLSGPRFSIPGRSYHLFTGPVADAGRVGHWVTVDWFVPQSPSIFWPTDHSWCVATEIDYDSTLVGGSHELINQVTGTPDLEALRIAPWTPRWDTQNT